MSWWQLALMLLGYMFFMDCVRRIAKHVELRVPLKWRPFLTASGRLVEKLSPKMQLLWVATLVGIVGGFYVALWLVTVHMGLN